MKRPIPGNFHVSGSEIEPVRAFIPSPLPPNPPIEMTPQRQRDREGAFQKKPLLGIRQISQSTQMAIPTATRGVLALERSGIIREITGGRRNRAFSYDRYLEVMSEGGDAI